MQLQDRSRSAELMRAVTLQRLEIPLVGAVLLHRGDVVNLGGGQRAKGHRHGKRVEDAGHLAFGISPDKRVEVAGLGAVARPDPRGNGKHEGLAPLDRQEHPVEARLAMRQREVERSLGAQNLDEDVAVRDAPVLQLWRPEAKDDPVTLDLRAEPARDRAPGREPVFCRGQNALAPSRKLESCVCVVGQAFDAVVHVRVSCVICGRLGPCVRPALSAPG